MSTDTEHTRESSAEQVEITPELLDEIESAGMRLLDNNRDAGLFTADAKAYERVTQVRVVQALVRRIRELESEREKVGNRLVPNTLQDLHDACIEYGWTADHPLLLQSRCALGQVPARLHDAAGLPLDF